MHPVTPLMVEGLYSVADWIVSLQDSSVEPLTSRTLEDDYIWR